MCGAFRDPVAKAEETLERGWQARPDVAPWLLALPIDWLADPFEDRNWRFQLNAWRPLDVLVTAHSQSGDDAFLDPLIALMADWMAFAADHPDEPALWNDMGTGLRAAKLAYVLTQPGFGDGRFDGVRPRLTGLARRHLERLRDREFIGDSNHGLFQVHGAMALVKALPEAPESADAEAYIEALFGDLLKSQFSADGVHLEHSPGYHVFALKTVERFLASGWYDSMIEVRRLMALARGNLAWFVFPDGCLSAIGDSSRAPVRVPFKRRRQRVVGRLFREGGYAVVRNARACPPDQASMLLVAGAHHSNVHKHADELSFELFSRGRFVVVDTGKYTYSRKGWRDYTDGASAHNAIDLIAERTDNGVRRTAPAGSVLTRLSKMEWGWVVEGAIERPQWGLTHSRAFLFRPGEWLVLLDRVLSEETREVTAWLHLAPDLEATRQGSGWRFEGGGIRYAASCPFALLKHRGESEPRIQGWVAAGYHRRVPNDALGLSAVGSDIRLATTILLNDKAEGPQVDVLPEGLRVTWRGEALVEGGRTTDPSPSRNFWNAP